MRRLVRFLGQGLWEIDLRERSLIPRSALGAMRIVLYVGGKFSEHLIAVRAAALTTSTLLALIPTLAVIVAAARGLGVDEQLRERFLSEEPKAAAPAGEPASEAVVPEEASWYDEVIDQVVAVVDKTDFRALGLVGVLVLAYAAYSLFLRTEESLNFAWRVRSRLAIWTRLSTFVSLVVLVPLLMAGALAGSSALRVTKFVQWISEHAPWAEDVVIDAVPYVLASLAMTGLFRFMPSTRVKWRSALLSGIFAGVGLIATYEIYVSLQVGVGRQSEIYGTLAAIPLLILYLQTGWMVVVIGAEIGYAYQNLHLIGPGRDLERLSPAIREDLAWRLVEQSAGRFAERQGPLDLSDAAQALDLPIEWLEQISEDLAEGGLVLLSKAGQVSPCVPVEDLTREAVAKAIHGRVPESLERRIQRAFG